MTTEFSTELAGALPVPPGVLRREQGINLMRMIRLRGPLMIAVSLILAVPAMLCVWFLVPEEYEASADIRFAAKRLGVMTEDSRGIAAANYDKWVYTQVRQIRGPTILTRVLDDPEVRALAPVREAKDRLAYLMGIIDARVQSGSELVSVTCQAKDRDVATKVLRATVDKYMEYAYNMEVRTDDVRRSLLVQERDDQQKELDILRDRIKSLKKALGMPLGDGASLGVSETQPYRENLSQAQADVISAEYKIESINAAIERVKGYEEGYRKSPDEPVYAEGVESRVAASPQVILLRQELAKLNGQIAVVRDKYVQDAPSLRTLTESRAALDAQEKQASREARGEALKTILALYGEQLALAEKSADDARERLAKFNTMIDEYAGRALQAATGKAEIDALEVKAQDLQQKLSAIEEKIYTIDVEGKAPGQVSLASNVFVPASPDYGRRLQFMALAFMLSVGAGVGAGLWREFTDKQIRTPQDLAALTSLPILAMVPHSSVDRFSGDDDAPMLTAAHPGSTSADQFRRILTRIIYPPEGSAEINTCLVVSPSRGDGKTSLACNLATALARADRRVLLVDINARNPVVEDYFGIGRAPGLGEILFNECEPNDVVRGSGFENLSVIGPGFRGEELIGKLASRETVEFLEQAEQAFEHVIIDTPPALLMSDAKLLAPIVDGVILVVGAGVSTTGMVQRCLNDMEQIGANVAGVVLNGVRPTRGGYLRHNLSLYYDYSRGTNGRRQAEELPRIKLIESETEEEAAAVSASDEADEPDAGAR